MTQLAELEPTTVAALPGKQDTEISAAEIAEASSAHARINIPLNLECWKNLPQDIQDRLLWFHQYCLDAKLSLKESAQALCYDTSTLHRVLKGTYAGSWENVAKAIDGYQKLLAERASIQKTHFAENAISKMIWSGLDYAMANNSIVNITGESGMGKTFCAEQWRDRNNHGRTVMVEIPPIGGTKAFMRKLCSAVGVNKNLSMDLALEGLLRAFNPNRMLIIDEARRLLPSDTRGDPNPARLETIRYIHDQTHCAVALLCTQRFTDTLTKLDFQYEQVLGRSLPVRLFRTIEDKDFVPVLSQYIKKPSAKAIGAAREIVCAHAKGHFRLLTEILKVASRLANKAKRPLSEDDFFTAIALRLQMMGETQFAKKGEKAA